MVVNSSKKFSTRKRMWLKLYGQLTAFQWTTNMVGDEASGR